MHKALRPTTSIELFGLEWPASVAESVRGTTFRPASPVCETDSKLATLQLAAVGSQRVELALRACGSSDRMDQEYSPA